MRRQQDMLKGALAGATVVAGLAGPQANAATLTVRIGGVGSTGATVYVALCQEALDERNCRGIARAAGRQGSMTFRVPSVPPGRYAAVAYEDENGNGRLDRVLGIPREPHGVSGEAGRDIIPSFQRAAFDLGEPGATIDLTLSRIGQ